MRVWRTWRQDDFSGGMVKRRAPSPRVLPNECEYLRDFDLGDGGLPVVRDGFEPMGLDRVDGGAINNPIQNITVSEDGSGVKKVTAFCAGKAFTWDEGTSSWSAITAQEWQTAVRINTVQVEHNLMVVLDGNNAPKTLNPFNGAVASVGGSPPVAYAGCMYYKHLFLNTNPSVSATPRRVYYSETDDINTGYGGTNYFFDVEPDPTTVYGFLPLENELLIFKGGSITSLRGTNPRDFSQPINRPSIIADRGGIAYTAVEVNGIPWVVDTTGRIISIHGGTPVTQSDLVDDLASRIDLPQAGWAPQNLPGSQPTSVRRVRHNLDQVIFFYKDRDALFSGLTWALVGHPGMGREGRAAWTIYGLASLSGGGAAAAADDEGTIYLGTVNGFMYRSNPDLIVDKLISGASTIDIVVPSKFVSGPINLGPALNTKTLREVRVQAFVDDAGSLTAGVDADNGREIEGRLVTLGSPSFDAFHDEDSPEEFGAFQVKGGRAQFSVHGVDHRIEINSTSDPPGKYRLSSVEADAIVHPRRRSR